MNVFYNKFVAKLIQRFCINEFCFFMHFEHSQVDLIQIAPAKNESLRTYDKIN